MPWLGRATRPRCSSLRRRRLTVLRLIERRAIEPAHLRRALSAEEIANAEESAMATV
ncbi:MAG: hypothetical protein ACOC8H_01295 [bacterium]